MKEQKRLRDYGITIGRMVPGRLNSITDVPGIQVGHVTLNEGDVKTGVTAVLPHEGNLFKEKVTAAAAVLNGFGKSMGLVQIEELGTIETPIIFTNTLSIGTASDGLLDYVLQQNEDIGDTTGTVNPVVVECNDGYLNDIRKRVVKKSHVLEAIENARVEFQEGSVGAGTGMSALGVKGGIGTASRLVELEGQSYTVGSLVLSNFGEGQELLIDGKKAGQKIQSILKNSGGEKDQGSIIILIATDIPLNERQLKRVARRAAVGLSRTGSYIGNGSGDIALAFSTANKVAHYQERSFTQTSLLHEDRIDSIFKAAAESVEEAILNSLICAETTIGREGRVQYSLQEFMTEILNEN